MNSVGTTNEAALCVEVVRGPIREAVHRAYFAAVDAGGSPIAAAGDPNHVTSLRSAAKPLQAVPLVTLPAAGALDLRDEELAICCASHPGTARHAALAASVLALSGFLPDELVCGPAGEPPSPLRHGCSGNHAGILLTAHLLGVPLAGYETPGHPVQRLLEKTVRELAAAPEMLTAVDGCGIPTFGMRLCDMARAFANLTRPGAPWSRIPSVMGRHPELIGAEDWIDVNLMQATGGRLIAKTGAEGLLCIGVRDQGMGMAVKSLDGSTRALGVLAIEALRIAGWLEDDELNDLRLRPHVRPMLLASTGECAAAIRLREDSGYATPSHPPHHQSS